MTCNSLVGIRHVFTGDNHANILPTYYQPVNTALSVSSSWARLPLPSLTPYMVLNFHSVYLNITLRPQIAMLSSLCAPTQPDILHYDLLLNALRCHSTTPLYYYAPIFFLVSAGSNADMGGCSAVQTPQGPSNCPDPNPDTYQKIAIHMHPETRLHVFSRHKIKEGKKDGKKKEGNSVFVRKKIASLPSKRTVTAFRFICVSLHCGRKLFCHIPHSTIAPIISKGTE